jgi:hypothetical protein
MDCVHHGYWDFYQDGAGDWHWRFCNMESQRVIFSSKRHPSSAECVQDAIEHGYSSLSERRVTRAVD